jgi:hypothetical protein
MWPELAAHAEIYFGDPSQRVLAILRIHAIVLDKLGRPELAAVTQRADAN